jgi:hypothetical protein
MDMGRAPTIVIITITNYVDLCLALVPAGTYDTRIKFLTCSLLLVAWGLEERGVERK